VLRNGGEQTGIHQANCPGAFVKKVRERRICRPKRNQGTKQKKTMSKKKLSPGQEQLIELFFIILIAGGILYVLMKTLDALRTFENL
jgi:hypothetical protein